MSALPPPSPRLAACVVVPAHDEEARIGACIAALGAQREVGHDRYEVILVLDRCADGTARRARAAAPSRLRLHLVEADAGGPGPARRRGMDLAAGRLAALGRERGLIATTDADSVPGPDWLARQLALVDEGAEAIGGYVEVGDDGAGPAGLLRREARLAARAAATGDPEAAHPFFSGASLALTVAAHRRVGGLPVRTDLEDQALAAALDDAGVPILRTRAVRVRTSGRTDGRARHGLAADLRLDDWAERRTWRAGDFDPEELAARKDTAVSVVVPCRETAETIGPILDAIAPLRAAGLVDEVVVLDAASRDGTAGVAAAHGALVVQESDVVPEMGPCRGKGDAMWRALAVTRGGVVAYIDGDTSDFHAGFVTGILGPLFAGEGIVMAKGAFLRPLRTPGGDLPGEGGRVTELVARPVLSLVAPELGCFAQPLAGEVAVRREVLERLSFPVGYGVETAMLIDVWRAHGLDAMAQVDLGTRQNRHQPLRDLGAMALEVMGTALSRGLPRDAWAALATGRMLVPDDTGGVLPRDVPLEERPPMAELLAATA